MKLTLLRFLADSGSDDNLKDLLDCGCSSKFVQKVTHIHIVTACQWFSKINSKKPVMVAIYNSMHDL